MKFTIKIFDMRYNLTYDVSDVVSDVSITTYLHDNPGKLEFTLYSVSPITFTMGAGVSVVVDGYKMFKGFIFSWRGTNESDPREVKVTAYDQMRYLKNKDFKVFQNMTSDQIFKDICKTYLLKYKIIDKSNYICPSRVEDATSLYDMIQNSLDATLAFSGQWFYIRDNFGVLEHRNILSSMEDYVIGDKSYLAGWDFEETIDKDVYTQIKLYRDNKETGKRDTYITAATSDIQKERILRYGILQLYEKIDENMTEAQIRQKGKILLSRYSKIGRNLSIKAIGIKSFHAGSLFKIKISKISRGAFWLDNYFLATQCTHKFKNDEHTMEIETEGMMSIKTGTMGG